MLIYTLTTGEGPHLATTCRWGEEYCTRYGRSYVMDNLWRRCMTRSLSATRQMRKVHLARRICRSVDSCGWKLLRGAAGRNHVKTHWSEKLFPGKSEGINYSFCGSGILNQGFDPCRYGPDASWWKPKGCHRWICVTICHGIFKFHFHSRTNQWVVSHYPRVFTEDE